MQQATAQAWLQDGDTEVSSEQPLYFTGSIIHGNRRRDSAVMRGIT